MSKKIVQLNEEIIKSELKHHRAIHEWHTCLHLFRHTSQKSLPVALLQPANFCIL